MKNYEHLYIHLTRTEIAVIVSDTGAPTAHIITMGALPGGAFSGDMSLLHTAVGETLVRANVHVQSVTLIIPDEQMYVFAEVLHTHGHVGETAETRISRMIPIPIEEVVWAETTLKLPEPLITYSIVRRALAEGIAQVVREKTGVRTTHCMSTTTALWTTLAQPPSVTLVVTHDVHSIDAGLFAPGILYPLMTLSVPTKEGEQSPESTISNLMSSAATYARGHYQVVPKNVVLHSETVPVDSIQSVATGLGCTVSTWEPRTQYSSSDSHPDTWEAVCAVLATMHADLLPGIALGPDTAHGSATQLHTHIIEKTRSLIAWVGTHTKEYAVNVSRTTYTKAVVIFFVVALGVLLWTLITFI